MWGGKKYERYLSFNFHSALIVSDVDCKSLCEVWDVELNVKKDCSECRSNLKVW